MQNLPPTSGKVVITTNVGDIDVELWTKEAPLACRNFVQLCMEVKENPLLHPFLFDLGDTARINGPRPHISCRALTTERLLAPYCRTGVL